MQSVQKRPLQALWQGLQLFARDVAQGLLVLSHNTLALLGLALVALVLTITTQAPLRAGVEQQLLAWLLQRQEARSEANGEAALPEPDPEAVQRVTAADPRSLTKAQAAIAQHLTRRYKVALEPVSKLVQEAWSEGARARIDPTLVLAVMAVESGFNPFAQSPVGAQGLMQVMTLVHDDKYERFGGLRAAFDPVTNLKVGVQVLRECIQRGGSVAEGLRFYVGAANLPSDGGYAERVLFEHESLKAVAAGQPLPQRPARTPAEPEPAASESLGQVAQL